MRQLLEDVLALQPAYSSRNTPEMQQRGVLIRQTIPAWLSGQLSSLSKTMGPVGVDLAVEGRDGTGQKSEIPWVRVYSDSRSPSANEGWYCVYLFRRDGTGVYLCLGQASTRYQDGDFKPRSAEELASLVEWAKQNLGTALTSKTGLASAIELRGQGKLGPAYERGTVCCKYYERGSVPDESLLISDLAEFMGLLRVLYDAEDLGQAPDNPDPEVRTIEELAETVASPLRSRSRKGQGFGLTPEERRAVERRAMELARVHLIAAGYEVEDVSHNRPFDFVASTSARTVIVEVKGTTGGLGSIVLTTNEVAVHQARHPDNALIVVHSIELDRTSKPPRAGGGVLFELAPWSINASALKPLSYQYDLGAGST